MLDFIKKNWIIITGVISFFLISGNANNSRGADGVITRTNSISSSILNILGICKYCVWGIVIGVYFKDTIARFFVNVGRNFIISNVGNSNSSFLASDKVVQKKEHRTRSALAGV